MWRLHPRRRRLPEKGGNDPLAVALKALNRREHSIAEIEAKLTDRGFDRDEIEDAVGELVLSGALDDARFARAFAADKRELSGWGPERIEGALAEKGISQELIDECCGNEGREELVERARALLAERGATVDDDRERSRALGFLTRRGFDYEVAYDAIRAATAARA
jgi:regulatory protein